MSLPFVIGLFALLVLVLTLLTAWEIRVTRPMNGEHFVSRPVRRWRLSVVASLRPSGNCPAGRR
jgi:hypothetical protein